MPTNLTDTDVIREAAKMAGWSLERTCGNLIQVPLRGGYCEMPPTVLMDDTDALLELVGAVCDDFDIAPHKYDSELGLWDVSCRTYADGDETRNVRNSGSGIIEYFRSALLALLRQVVEEKNNG